MDRWRFASVDQHREHGGEATYICGHSISEKVTFQISKKRKMVVKNSWLLVCGEGWIPTSYLHKNEFQFRLNN